MCKEELEMLMLSHIFFFGFTCDLQLKIQTDNIIFAAF